MTVTRGLINDLYFNPDGKPGISSALLLYCHVAYSTLFRPRPGTTDQSANKQDRLRIMQKYIPPVLHTFGEKVMYKLRLL